MTERCDSLVIGTGNIAKRHIANLRKLHQKGVIGCVSSSGRYLTSKDVDVDVIFKDKSEARKNSPRMAIIASPSSFHLQDAGMFLAQDIPVLIEKPITDSINKLSSFKKTLQLKKDLIEIGYNYRYSCSLIKFKEIIQEKNLLGDLFSVHIEVGQYLPQWRADKDYTRSVSANKNLGGGALLELSHELDYLLWIFGDFESVYCRATNSGKLKIDVEDLVDALLVNETGLVVHFHSDFLQRNPTRYCKVKGEKGTLTLNLLNSSIIFEDNEGREKIIFCELNYDKNKMYLDMMKRFYKLAKGDLKPLITVEEATKVVSLVESMKLSSFQRKVISLAGDN